MDKDQKNESSHPIKNIVLVGRAGNGKCAVGNSIAGRKVFDWKMHHHDLISKSFRVVTPDGSILNLIDTPGLCDLSVSADFVSKEIVRCLTLAEGGIHAVLLVLSVRNRITKEEEMVLSSLQVLFGSKILDYLIVVVSGADELEANKTTFEEYMGNKLPEFLKRILIMSGKRMILFDNRTKDEAKQAKQVHDLLTLVDLVRKQNNNKPYTDEMYHKIKEETDKEQEELESKRYATEELEALKKELQLTFDMTLKAMFESMAQTMEAAAEAQHNSYEAKFPEMDKDQNNESSHPIRNIVLVGRAGNGKSATGNSIARQKVFHSRAHAAGVTMSCQTFRVVTPDGPILNVIDTPGLCDLSVSDDFITNEIVRCLTLAEGGLDAVLFVLSVRNRITKEEEMVLSSLQVLFGSKILDYFIVVFTGGDELELHGITLDDYLGDDLPECLKRILIMSGKRMILFDNRTKDEAKQAKQVHDLLTLVDLVRKQNNNKPYTDEMYRKESKGHATEQLEAMRKELRLTYEITLKAMSESMAQTMKAAAEAQHNSYEAKFPEMDKDQKNESSHPIKNILLVGRAGNGKCAMGNSIAGRKVFEWKMHHHRQICKSFRVVTPDGPILNLIDTAGLCDLSVSTDFITNEIVKCLTLAKGGIHAVLFVLSVRNRMTAEEEMVLSSLQVLFGSKILDYFIVVFTGGDELELHGITLDDYLGDDLPECLKRILIMSGKRMILFDNRTKDEAKQAKQVHDLLTLVDLVRKQNNNKPYTDEMYRKESKGHATEQLEAMRKELRLTYEITLKAMSVLIAKTLKAGIEAKQHRYDFTEKQGMYESIIAEIEGNMRKSINAEMEQIKSIQ